MAPLLVDPERLRFRALIGTGGIGTGSFFALQGDHTLGREESRMGRFLESRNYAKLHIICHYVQTLLGPSFKSLPIGRVGADDPGSRLCEEMTRGGLDLRHVHALEHAPTMNCVCLLYPDGSGGNLTVSDSACTRVDAEAICEAQDDFAAFEGRGIALAVPEVPLEARAELLELGTQHGFLRAASFTSEEMEPALRAGMLANLDILVINRDEAAALTRESGEETAVLTAMKAMEILRDVQPSMSVIVTAGEDGSWAWDGAEVAHWPAQEVDAVSAAGAGDAFFAGVLAGLAAGLPLMEAQQLGSCMGALSVTSPHTIHPGLDRSALAAYAQERQTPLTDGIIRLLGIRS